MEIGESLELALLGFIVYQAIVSRRRYRGSRGGGQDGWAAAEDALAAILPRPVAHLVVMEPRLYLALFRWLTRRFHRGESEFSYHKRTMLGILVILMLFLMPGEVVLPAIFLPWEWLKWVLIVGDLYALLWFAGLYASLVVMPHRLEVDGLRLHYGVMGGGWLPYRDIVDVCTQRRTPGGRDGLRVSESEEAASIGVGGETDVRIELSAPHVLQGFLGRTAPITTVRLAVDEPARFVRELQTRSDAIRQEPATATGSGDAMRRDTGD